MPFSGAICFNFSTENPYGSEEDFMLITTTSDWDDPYQAWDDIRAGSDFDSPINFYGDYDSYYRTFVISPIGEDGKIRMSAVLFIKDSYGDMSASWNPPEGWGWSNGFVDNEYPQEGDTVQVYQGMPFKIEFAPPPP